MDSRLIFRPLSPAFERRGDAAGSVSRVTDYPVQALSRRAVGKSAARLRRGVMGSPYGGEGS